MIRLFIILMSLVLSLNAKADINKKITTANSRLHSFSQNYLNLNHKMALTAKAILKQKKKLNRQKVYLAKLKNELKDKAAIYKKNSITLSVFKTEQNKLKTRQQKIEEKLVFLIAQSVTLSVMIDEKQSTNSDALIEFEVLQSMLKNSKKRVEKLNKLFFTNSSVIENLDKKTKLLQAEITSIDQKRKKLQKLQHSNTLALKKLKNDKASYKKKLQSLLAKQDSLKKTLAKLNIIKIDMIKKAQEEQLRKEAFKKKSITLSNKNLPKVKRHGNSYQSVKTKKYRGPKTIAPLEDYTISKKYGTYTDPIYGIKIFNESVYLKSKKPNARVKTVFNGKVIYADKTAVLKNIVIVEHKNGLHTIYANLSQIAPNIKKGKKIKKGYTIGRVSDELIFEVTQKSYHINPIRLFQ